MLVVGAICERCGVSALYVGIHKKKALIDLLRNEGWQVDTDGWGQLFTLCKDCRPDKKGSKLEGSRKAL